MQHPVRLATTAALALGLAVPFVGAAAAAPPTTISSPGLFGTQDPTYDGVYRQSLAILAYAALDEAPPAEAVDWLLDQQCDNGGWQPFRADTSKPCAESDISTYAGPDSNSTALAVQALLTVDEQDAADDGLTFLESLQQSDGGIAYLDGAASDTNSSALTAAAVSAFGIPLSGTTNESGASLLDALAAAQIDCEGASTDRGGYRFQSGDEPFGNDFASVQAVLGAAGQGLPVVSSGSDDSQTAPTCPANGAPTSADRTSAGAWYLAQRITAGNGSIESAYSPGSTDWGSTRFAVIALAASGHGRTAIGQALTALAGSQDTTLRDTDGVDLPGAIAELILANEAGSSALTVTSTARRSATTTTPRAATPPTTPSATSAPAPTSAAPKTAPPTTSAPAPMTTPSTTSPAETPSAETSPSTPDPSTPVVTTAPPTSPASATSAPAASGSTSAAAKPVRRQAQLPSIDSDALLARLDATLQRSATTAPTTSTTSRPSTSTPAPAADDAAGSDLARTGSTLPYPRVAAVAAALVFAGAVMAVATRRRTRGTH